MPEDWETELHEVKDQLTKMSVDFAAERKDWLKWLRGGVVGLLSILTALAMQWGVLKWRVEHLAMEFAEIKATAVTRQELADKLDAIAAMHEYRHSVLLEKMAEIKAAQP